MAFNSTFEFYSSFAIVVDGTDLQNFIQKIANCVSPAWQQTTLTPISAACFPNIVAVFTTSVLVNTHSQSTIFFECSDGLLQITQMNIDGKSGITPPLYNKIIRDFNNRIQKKGISIVYCDGRANLQTLLSDTAINLLQKFESYHNSKTTDMSYEAAYLWANFKEQVSRENAVKDIIDHQTDILRDCCGFTQANANDFAMKYGFHE